MSGGGSVDASGRDRSGEVLDVLVVASYDGADARSIGDFLFSFRAFSRHRYHYVLDPRRLGAEVDLATFDVVLVFWSASLVEASMDEALCERLGRAPARKFVFAQDEQRDLALRLARLAALDAAVVFTCAAERDHEAFYPSRSLPRLEARYTVLPGYVPESLENRVEARRAIAGRDARPVDVGYRARTPPFWLGDLARRKVEVAERMGEACRARGLVTDVSVRELDRLYGAAWLRFLARSRCVLGAPSGASVVDVDGTLARDVARGLVRRPETTYAEARERWFAARDGRLAIDTVSARVFEAAALGCALVQVVGEYGGVLAAGEHYVPVATDFGDVDAAADRLLDRDACRALAANAHRDLVASGRYSYRRFVEWFDGCVARHARRARTRVAPSPAAFHLRRAAFHGQPFLPFGAGAIAAPLPLPLATLALRGLPLRRIPGGPVLQRALRHPRGFADRLLTLLALLVSEPDPRRLWRLRRAVESPPPAWKLAEDLVKLSLAVRSRRGTLRSPRPFAVDLEAENEWLWLVSRRSEESASARSESAPRVDLAAIRGVVWDHSQVGGEASWVIGGTRVATVSVGDSGVHVCGALSDLCRRLPERIVPALASWLGVRAA